MAVRGYSQTLALTTGVRIVLFAAARRNSIASSCFLAGDRRALGYWIGMASVGCVRHLLDRQDRAAAAFLVVGDDGLAEFKLAPDLGDFRFERRLALTVFGAASGDELLDEALQCFGAELAMWDDHRRAVMTFPLRSL